MGKVQSLNADDKEDTYFTCDCGSDDFSVLINLTLNDFTGFECCLCKKRIEFESMLEWDTDIDMPDVDDT